MPLNRLTNLKPSSCGGKLIQVGVPNVCSIGSGGVNSHYGSVSSTSSNSDYSVNGQYHWDCSDWARTSQNPLPDITEVPSAEIADSSSFHSNDSNESKPLTYVFQSNLLLQTPYILFLPLSLALCNSIKLNTVFLLVLK